MFSYTDYVSRGLEEILSACNSPAHPAGHRVLLLTQWFDPRATFKGMVFARELVRRGLRSR